MQATGILGLVLLQTIPCLQEVAELAPFGHPEGVPDDVIEPRGGLLLDGLPGHHPPQDAVRRLAEHAVDAHDYAI